MGFIAAYISAGGTGQTADYRKYGAFTTFSGPIIDIISPGNTSNERLSIIVICSDADIYENEILFNLRIGFIE